MTCFNYIVFIFRMLTIKV